MVNCSFCGNFIEKGTGKIFAKKDGTIYNFCSRKCEKNQLKLGRSPQNVKWTKAFHKIKAIMKKGK
ncbi:MAG: 50S ribosomal protein L24e [Candidatus Diapherotrites archaeon]|nr:50S ribosomal protein L24e [Candidatus Diapherotrites archaeon]